MISFEREYFSLNDPEIPTEEEIANAKIFMQRSKDLAKEQAMPYLSIPFLKNTKINHKSIRNLLGAHYINDEVVQIVTESITHRHSVCAPYKRILFTSFFVSQLCGALP